MKLSECRCCKYKLDYDNGIEICGFVSGTVYLVVECKNCGSLQTTFNLQDNPNRIYNAIYKNAHKISGYKRYFAYSFLFKWIIKLKFLNPLYLDKLYFNVWKVIGLNILKKNKKILDVGCGLGYFTGAMRRMGYNCFGIDLSNEAIQEAIRTYGPYFKCIDITENNSILDKEKYDVIVCLEIIEHLDNIDIFFQSILSKLNNGGVAIISTPVAASRKEWTSTEPPVHLTQFSEKGIRLLSQRLKCTVEFYSDSVNYKNVNNFKNIYSKLPGGVLSENHSVNLRYFDNGNLSLRFWFSLLSRYIINIFRFRFLDPKSSIEHNASIGSYIFTLKKISEI